MGHSDDDDVYREQREKALANLEALRRLKNELDNTIRQMSAGGQLFATVKGDDLHLHWRRKPRRPKNDENE